MDVDRTLKTDFYYWRLFATGLCFVAFGVGGLVLGFLVTPLLHVAIRDRARRQRLVRKLVHWSFGLFIGVMRFLRVMTYEFHGLQRLSEPGQFVIANHPTLIDIVFLVARIPDGICVVKDELLRNYWLGALLRQAGYVGNAADPQTSLATCADALRSGATLIMFPEGSRSVPGTTRRLRRGAAYVALATQKDLTPVHISCTPPTLTKANRWHDIPSRRMHFVIDVGDRIPVAPPDSSTSQRVSARAITERVTRHLLQETPVYE